MHKHRLWPVGIGGTFESRRVITGHSLPLQGILLTIVLVAGTAHADGPTTRFRDHWQHQFGTANGERAYGVASDGAFIFVTGQIDRGYFPGESNVGMADCFVRKYAKGGATLWTRQFGTTGSDRAAVIAAGQKSFFVAGSTTGAFSGHANAGGVDLFVCRYDQDMQYEWVFMTGSSGDDEAVGIALDQDCLYVAGWTDAALPGQTLLGSMDAFVIKLDLDGNVIWIRQFGTAGYDKAHGLAVDADAVYVTGRAGLALPGQTHLGSADAFVRRYTADGDEVWTEQFGTATADIGYGLTVHRSDVYVTGKVSASLPGQQHYGGSDGFVRKFDSNGVEEWTSQFGTFGMEEAFGVAIHHNRVYVVGTTSGALSPLPAYGAGDAFIRQMDLDGNELTTTQIGSARRDDAQSVMADASGVYIAGHTAGALPAEASAGSVDGFVIRTGEPPVVAPGLRATMMQPATPNPFNPTTLITYTLSAPGTIRLEVYDVLGHRVDTLVERSEASGEHTVQWNAVGLASGAYFIRLEAAGLVESQRVMLLK